MNTDRHVRPFVRTIRDLSARYDSLVVQSAVTFLAEALLDVLSMGQTLYISRDPLLTAHCCESVLVSSDVHTPFVYETMSSAGCTHFYLSRYYTAECQLVDTVMCRLRVDAYRDSRGGWHADALSEEQQAAVSAAFYYPFLSIMGGPGTGKTSVIAAIIEQFLAVHPGVCIVLLAPTGKAVSRLIEVVGERFPVMTIHRFLSSRLSSLWDSDLVIADLVIVDEMSMLDLVLACELFRVLSVHTRLILVGDPKQLYAVEAGTILGSGQGWGRIDHNTAFMPACVLTEPVVHLTHCYRFGDQADLMRLAQSVYDSSETFLHILSSHTNNIHWYGACGGPSDADIDVIMAPYDAFFKAVSQEQWSDALLAFAAYRVLVPFRSGSWGTDRLNRMMSEMVQRRLGVVGPYYLGLPIMVTQNDPWLSLYNGDIGFLYRHQEDWYVWFSEAQQCPLDKIAAWEIAYVMTVHKAQGSEFAHVSVLFSSDRVNVLSQQWLYTALTRAKQQISIFASSQDIDMIVRRKEERFSGIAYKIEKRQSLDGHMTSNML